MINVNSDIVDEDSFYAINTIVKWGVKSQYTDMKDAILSCEITGILGNIYKDNPDIVVNAISDFIENIGGNLND